MKTHLGIRLICIFACVFSTVSAETAEDLAKEIIRQEFTTAHNASNGTPEELERITAANSRLRLNWLMQHDRSISEEIRICYAIRVIDDVLGLHRVREIGVERAPKEIDLMKKRLILARRLIELDQTKAEQGGTGQAATRPESKSEGSDKPQPEAEGRSR